MTTALARPHACSGRLPLVRMPPTKQRAPEEPYFAAASTRCVSATVPRKARPTAPDPFQPTAHSRRPPMQSRPTPPRLR
eukprot:scaffold101032_cov28-Tisochrysis_lutea.AAC.7